jgi:3D (Asp-Asp-Asp) domain-containing protein
MSCRQELKFKHLQLALAVLCALASPSALRAQVCQALFSTVPVPGSFADAGATCVPAMLVDLGNGTVADRANHLLWAKDVAFPAGSVGDYETYCAQLVLGGRTGWSLPDVAQLQTLLPPGTCQAAMNGCGLGVPDLPGNNGITWSSSSVSPESYYCPGYGCPYYGWQVATGLGTNFGVLLDVPLLPPRKRVDAGTYANSGTVRCVAGGLNLAITLDATDPVKVPALAKLSGSQLLTQAHLSLKLTEAGSPVSGVALTLRSSRTTLDQFTAPGSTAADGTANAYVSTRDQSSNSTIDSTTPLVWTNPKAVVSWLPAKYVTPFNITCYITALESDFSGSFVPASNFSWCSAPPVSRSYRQKFMAFISRQGSGKSVQSEIIQYNSNRHCYYLNACPQTSSGACATVGTTAAVAVAMPGNSKAPLPAIPFNSLIAVDTLGMKLAEDTGGGLSSYQVDVYNGFGNAACMPLPWSSPQAVTFEAF